MTQRSPEHTALGRAIRDLRGELSISQEELAHRSGMHRTYLDNPARVQAPVPGVIKKLNSSKWAYELDLKVPQVLQIVAGVPIALKNITITAGSSSKDWLATTSCSGGKYPYSLTTSFSTGTTSTALSSVPCS